MELTNFSQQDQENWKTIFAKCYEDAGFKQELISNPVQTLEKLAGKKINTGGFNFVVTDQTDPSTVYVNIPVNQNAQDLELSEEQMELVAGGMCIGIEVKGKVTVEIE